MPPELICCKPHVVSLGEQVRWNCFVGLGVFFSWLHLSGLRLWGEAFGVLLTKVSGPRCHGTHQLNLVPFQGRYTVFQDRPLSGLLFVDGRVSLQSSESRWQMSSILV